MRNLGKLYVPDILKLLHRLSSKLILITWIILGTFLHSSEVFPIKFQYGSNAGFILKVFALKYLQ